MKLIKNVKALSNLSIIILMIASLIVGTFISYLWVMGYYLTLTIKIPQKNALSISNVAFTNQDTSYFDVTFLNPSYAPSDFANITKITVKTEDNKLHNITQTSPDSLPYSLPRASDKESGEKTFRCTWNWANYTGQNIGIIAFIDVGSGPTYETNTPFVNLTITEARFIPSISLSHFNLTIQNSLDSDTYVNVSKIEIVVPTGTLEPDETSPTLPYKLDTNQDVTFRCVWNWMDYQNKSITIAAKTTQGYVAYYNRTTPLPVQVEIADIVYSETDMNHFNVTVRNSKESSAPVDINRIIALLENATKKEINGTITPDQLPYRLLPNTNKTFTFPLDWSHYRGKSITVYINTKQNYTVQYTKATPSPIEITEATFNAAYTDRFNVTVYNSALYYDSVLITNITLTLEDGTVNEINGTTISPELPEPINHGASKPFQCPWNWTDYQGRNVTITVRTSDNYVAQIVKVTPKRVILTIASISFDSVNTAIFQVTVRNSALSLENANITRMTITFENGTEKEMTSITPSLPHLLSPNSTVTFTCQWDWTNYRGKNITITMYAAKGYEASSLYTTPPLQ